MKKTCMQLAPVILLLAACSQPPAATVRVAGQGLGTVQLSSLVASGRSVQYANTEVQSAKVYLLASDDTTIASGTLAADGSHYSNGAFSYAIQNVPPGQYKATIEFYNGANPATSTLIGSGSSTDSNGAAAGHFTVASNTTVSVSIGTVTLLANPTGNANSSVAVNSATEATITFQ